MATILVVDDHPLNRELLVGVLAGRNHRLLEAADGVDALARVRAERPDLVICDILMPTMDGYEFVRRLRAEEELARTTVIFCTAHYHAREADGLAKAAGVARVITKPFEAQDVIAIVEDVLGAPRAPAPHAAPLKTYQDKHLRLVTDKLSQTVDELSTSNERLQALVELNLRLVSLRDPLQLQEELCRGARELIGARFGVLAVGERDKPPNVRFFASGIAPEIASTFAGADFDQGDFNTVLADRRMLRLAFARRARRVPGLPAGHPPVRSLLAAPIASSTTVHGWICLTDKIGAEEFSADDENLLSLLAALGGRGLETGSSYARLRRQAAGEVQALTRRLVDAQETERRLLARELHDRVGQNLTALSINLNILRDRGLGATQDDLRLRLDDSIALLDATAEAIENVMADLRPPVLEAEGLLPALRWYAQAFSQRTGIEVALHGELPAIREGHEVEITLFRIALEALTNVAKHARATQIDLTIHQTRNECVVSLSDNGVGFDPLAPRVGRGLTAMLERSQTIGGRFEVRSAPGQGTFVEARVPRLD